MYIPLTTINIHEVTAVAISPPECFKGTSWRNITIETTYGGFTISLFPAGDDITVSNHVPKLTAFGPNHCSIAVGEKTYYYSYNTIIALEDTARKIRIRSCSKTTGRHILSMGVAMFEVIEDDEFKKLL